MKIGCITGRVVPAASIHKSGGALGGLNDRHGRSTEVIAGRSSVSLVGSFRTRALRSPAETEDVGVGRSRFSPDTWFRLPASASLRDLDSGAGGMKIRFLVGKIVPTAGIHKHGGACASCPGRTEQCARWARRARHEDRGAHRGRCSRRKHPQERVSASGRFDPWVGGRAVEIEAVAGKVVPPAGIRKTSGMRWKGVGWMKVEVLVENVVPAAGITKTS